MFESSCEVALDFFLSKYLLIREKSLLLSYIFSLVEWLLADRMVSECMIFQDSPRRCHRLKKPVRKCLVQFIDAQN